MHLQPLDDTLYPTPQHSICRRHRRTCLHPNWPCHFYHGHGLTPTTPCSDLEHLSEHLWGPSGASQMQLATDCMAGPRWGSYARRDTISGPIYARSTYPPITRTWAWATYFAPTATSSPNSHHSTNRLANCATQWPRLTSQRRRHDSYSAKGSSRN